MSPHTLPKKRDTQMNTTPLLHQMRVSDHSVTRHAPSRDVSDWSVTRQGGAFPRLKRGAPRI